MFDGPGHDTQSLLSEQVKMPKLQHSTSASAEPKAKAMSPGAPKLPPWRSCASRVSGLSYALPDVKSGQKAAWTEGVSLYERKLLQWRLRSGEQLPGSSQLPSLAPPCAEQWDRSTCLQSGTGGLWAGGHGSRTPGDGMITSCRPAPRWESFPISLQNLTITPWHKSRYSKCMN